MLDAGLVDIRATPRRLGKMARHGAGLAALLLAGTALALNATPALAQVAGLASNPATPTLLPPPKPAKHVVQPDTLGLVALGKPLGRTLAEHGVYFTGRLLAEPMDQAAGGIKTGAYYEGYVAVGADLDMNKILGIKGGIVHISIGDLQGAPYYLYSGSTYMFNRAWTYGDEARLAEFDWEQQLFDNHVRFIAGRLSPSYDFDTSAMYCQFAFTSCSDPAGFIFDKSSTPYLTSGWGGALTLKPTLTTYIKGGAYENEASLSDQSDNNWPGPDWGLDRATGATFPVQIGYITHAPQTPYPEHYDIGAYYDTSPYADPFLNDNGLSRAVYGGTAAEKHGRSGLYLQAEKTIWHPADKPYQTLAVFGAANWGLTGDLSIEHEFSGGFRLTGPFATRPYDSVGFSAQYLMLDHGLVDRLDSTLHKERYMSDLSDDETGFEFDYGLFVAPGIQFTPFIFYSVHPDQIASAYIEPNVNTSLTLGATITISFAQALGMPALARHPF